MLQRVLQGEVSAGFDGRTVTYGFGELGTLVPAHAATIHKRQGPEVPAVIIPVIRDVDPSTKTRYWFDASDSNPLAGGERSKPQACRHGDLKGSSPSSRPAFAAQSGRM
ncbi:MAG TPA: hypothetical protein VMN39_08325 [Longimicrobiaceae bacterium]|nr:hypothetical protein [Longimicrobiaceae bacterium]